MDMLILTKIILIITTLINIFLLGVVFKSCYKKKLNQALIVHIGGIIFWAIFILVNIWLPQYTGDWEYLPGDWGYFFEKIIFVSAVVSISSLFWFAQIFTKEKIKKNFLNSVFFASQVFLVILCLFDNTIYTKIIINTDGQAYLQMAPLSILYSVFILVHIVASLVILFRAGNINKNNKVFFQQSRLIFYIFLIFLLICLTTNWILPVYFQIYSFNAFGPTISLITAYGLIYSINRYRFLDIKQTVQRGIIYVILVFLVISLYLVLLFVGAVIFQQTTHEATVISGGLTLLVGIFSVRPLEYFFRRLTDKFFHKDKYNYAYALHRLSELLNKNIDLNKLLFEVSEKLQDILKVKKVNILLIENKLFYQNDKVRASVEIIPQEMVKMMERHEYEKVLLVSEAPYIIENIKMDDEYFETYKKILKFTYETGAKFDYSIFVLVFLEKKLLAVIMIGEKKSGDDFTLDDISLLKTFSHQAAVAIEKAQLYQKEQSHSRELEKKVLERTEKIQKIQEEQKRSMLDISHNLLTPLTIIKGELGVFGKEIQSDKLKVFERSVDRVSSFVYDLLKISQLEAGQVKIEKRKLNLSNLVRASVEYFKIVAEKEKIEIIDAIENNIFINGSDEMLEQVIENILTNAIKYMKREGERKIFVELKNEGNEIIFIIKDTGIGINKENVDKIFDRFYREKQNNEIKGSGLGMAMTKEMIRVHDGEISVKSEIGQGTTFRIKFEVEKNGEIE